MAAREELPVIAFADKEALRAWFERHHDSLPGVWLKFAKKGSPRSTVSYAEALEEALCYGWIDGQVRRFDEHFYLQRLTPRRARSSWSQLNREKAERLIEQGRMAPAGLAQVQAARKDGRWEAAYPAQSAATVPDDLAAALARNPNAEATFAALTGSARYAFLYRLHRVSRPEARAKRIADYIERLSQGRTLQD